MAQWLTSGKSVHRSTKWYDLRLWGHSLASFVIGHLANRFVPDVKKLHKHLSKRFSGVGKTFTLGDRNRAVDTQDEVLLFHDSLPPDFSSGPTSSFATKPKLKLY